MYQKRKTKTNANPTVDMNISIPYTTNIPHIY